MRPTSTITLATFAHGQHSPRRRSATPARSDVIMDWNAKADTIAAEKRTATPTARRAAWPFFTLPCSRR